MKLQSAILLCLLAYVCTTSAQTSGYADPSFGDAGKTVIALGTNSFDLIRDVIEQPDQKIVAVGNSSGELAVVRLLLDGSPDPGFGSNGVVRFKPGGVSANAHAVAMTADEKLLVAIDLQVNGQYDWGVVRLHTNGVIDSTFGINGVAQVDIADGYEFPNAIEVLADGNILLAGKMPSKTYSDMVLMRFTRDGVLDDNFGDNGIVITSFREEDEAFDIAIQPDGKIIIAGFSSVAAQGDFAMARYTMDGELDASFGDQGRVLTDMDQASDFSRSIALLPDGKILLFGNANYYNLDFTSDIGFARYTSDGHLDPTFSGDGKHILTEGSKTDGNDMAVQADGKMLITGVTDHPNGSARWYLARTHDDGSLDSTFGELGFIYSDFPGSGEFGNAVIIGKDSRVIVGGASKPGADFDFAIARYIADFIVDVFITPPSCPGVNDASIDIMVTGGVAPYVFDMVAAPGYPLPDPGGSGYFMVQVTDASGASGLFGPYYIPPAPAAPEVLVEVVEDQIIVHINGVGLYSVSIDGASFVFDTIFTDVPDGLHEVTVRDENGCIIFEGDVLIDATSVESGVDNSAVHVFPNPGDGDFVIEIIDDQLKYVNVYDVLGKKINQHVQQAGKQWRVQINDALPGMYWLKMDFESGRRGVKLVVVE